MEQTPDLIELGQAVNRVIAGQALDRDQTRQVMTGHLVGPRRLHEPGRFPGCRQRKGADAR